MYTLNTIAPKDVTRLLVLLYKRYKAGAVSEAQAKSEAALLHSVLRAIETTELEARIDAIEQKVKDQ
jgi:hypothetical protein